MSLDLSTIAPKVDITALGTEGNRICSPLTLHNTTKIQTDRPLHAVIAAQVIFDLELNFA